jgi:hypothetical protein
MIARQKNVNLDFETVDTKADNNTTVIGISDKFRLPIALSTIVSLLSHFYQ